MQTEKSQSKSRRIMLDMRFTKFPALSIGQRISISWSLNLDWLSISRVVMYSKASKPLKYLYKTGARFTLLLKPNLILKDVL